MMSLHSDTEQRIQREEYSFPYHHIPTMQNGHFSQMRYWSWGFHYLSAIHYLVQRLRDFPFESLVDVGCGDGRFLCEVHACFPNKRLLGIDYSERPIRFAHAFCPQIDFVVEDITLRGDDAERFDIATCVEVLEHIPPDGLPNFVDAIWHIVRPGGHLIVTVPSTNKRLNPKHYQHFNSQQLRGVLAPRFEVQEFIFFDRLKYRVQLTQRLVHNQFFSLTWQWVLDKLYDLHLKKYFIASESDAGRIAAFCRKK
jgi:2-polyprenyl-3-methyl-5-hydroxy-6-metoxy-1,4-benzoquinol methylase